MSTDPIPEIYTIELDGEGNEVAITCLRCDHTSWNPKDVFHRYCGHCHTFLDDIWPVAREWWLQSYRRL